jgi:hypothetical protein
MNIYISENIDRAIDNFTIVPIVYGEIDLSSIPDNGATIISAIDAIDSIRFNNISNFIQNIVKKMRLNSTLYLGGCDIYAVSRSLISGGLDLEEYNSILINKAGVYSSKYIIDLLKSHGLNIQSVIYKGSNYEITATRPNNQN